MISASAGLDRVECSRNGNGEVERMRRHCIVYYSVYLHYIAWNHDASTGDICMMLTE
jgi:hypothetical protein